MEHKPIQTGKPAQPQPSITYPVAPASSPIETGSSTKPFYQYRSVNHNEILIMEGDWSLISTKVQKIDLINGFDLANILFGAAIPYAIDIFASFQKGETPAYFPFFVCIALWVIIKKLENRLKWLAGSNTVANTIHLDDLKNVVNRIEKNKGR